MTRVTACVRALILSCLITRHSEALSLSLSVSPFVLQAELELTDFADDVIYVV